MKNTVEKETLLVDQMIQKVVIQQGASVIFVYVGAHDITHDYSNNDWKCEMSRKQRAGSSQSEKSLG